MERHSKTLADVKELLQIKELFNTTINTVIDEWTNESSNFTAGSTTNFLPSHELYQAQRTILAIAGKLTELISEPCSRILEVACQYWECRALSIAAERRIPDLLAAKGMDGVDVKVLAEKTDIETAKLCQFRLCLYFGF